MLHNKSFTIMGSILSMLILSFCALSLNMFLLEMSSYLFYLQFQYKSFNIKRSLNSCFASGYGEDICDQYISK